MKNLTWCEISKEALTHNIQAFRGRIGDDTVLAPAVKANAYGHGLIEASRVMLEAGADYLTVNALYEAQALRKAGIKAPILIVGYTALEDLKYLAELDADQVVYNLDTLKKLAELGKEVKVHLKIETGNHRQGIEQKDLVPFLKIFKGSSTLKLQGVNTHFANIEDTTDPSYALYQLDRFKEALQYIEGAGLSPTYQHCANSAATILIPETHFNFVRTGVSNYGFWPSEETRQTAEEKALGMTFKPAMTWKTVVAQVKDVKKGAKVGYGCTYEVPEDGRIAILPIGYYDGYPRLMGNTAEVLIRGKRAPIVGRVCMNICMVNVSHIPEIALEDEVVLLGKQGSEEITAEEHGEWSQTINYEVTTRVNERIPRIFI